MKYIVTENQLKILLREDRVTFLKDSRFSFPHIQNLFKSRMPSSDKKMAPKRKINLSVMF